MSPRGLTEGLFVDWVVKDRGGRLGDGVGADAEWALLDQVKIPAASRGGTAAGLAELGHKPFRFQRGGSKTDDPICIGIEKGARSEAKGQVVPSRLGILHGKVADRPDQGFGVVRDRPLQIPCS